MPLFLEVRIVWDSEQSTSRIIQVESTTLLSDSLCHINQILTQSKVSQHLQHDAQFISVNVLDLSVLPQSCGVRFSNICGRIVHAEAYHQPYRTQKFTWTVYKERFQGALFEVTNAFGRNASIFSMSANFNTSERQQFTLFKGGVKTCKIKEDIGQLFHPDAVEDVTIHMVVATCKLDHFVNSTSSLLDNYLRSQQHVDCITIPVENQAGKRLKLYNFTHEFYRQNNLHNDVAIKDVLITIGYRGNVNMFFTFEREVPIDTCLEDKLMPLCKKIMNIAHDFT